MAADATKESEASVNTNHDIELLPDDYDFGDISAFAISCGQEEKANGASSPVSCMTDFDLSPSVFLAK